MVLNIPFFSSNWIAIVFCIVIIIIILFSDISIDKIIAFLAFVGIAAGLYRIITNSSSMLVIGLSAIIIVLLFVMASGYGRSQQTIIVQKSCDVNNNNTNPVIQPLKRLASCPKSNLASVGTCPNGYTNFTDGEGNTLCCGSSNINLYSHTCPALGPSGICAMAPGIEDPRSIGSQYPLCQKIREEQIIKNAKLRCPKDFKYYLQMPNSPNNYKCCGHPPGSDSTNCPYPESSCSTLFGTQNIFNAPDSCEARKFAEEISGSCPSGYTQNPRHNITDPKTKSTKTVLACYGPSAICYPKALLQKCISMGSCTNINIEKSLSNCDVLKKVLSNELKLSDVDITAPNFFN